MSPQTCSNSNTQIVKTHIVNKEDGSPRKLYEMADGTFKPSPNGTEVFQSVASYKAQLDGS